MPGALWHSHLFLLLLRNQPGKSSYAPVESPCSCCIINRAERFDSRRDFQSWKQKEFETKGYDTSVIYEFNEYPDVHSRCDNCDYTLFKSSVKGGKFLRECRRCGMKKIYNKTGSRPVLPVFLINFRRTPFPKILQWRKQPVCSRFLYFLLHAFHAAEDVLSPYTF